MTRDTHETAEPTSSELLILDPNVRQRLAAVFDQLDSLYDGIKTQTEYETKAIDVASITPSGVVIEARIVATPAPEYDKDTYGSPEYMEAVRRYHDTLEYMIFAIPLSEILSPDFSLRPLDMSDASVVVHRGSGIDISLADGTVVHLPQMAIVLGRRNDRIIYNGEPTEPFKEFRLRNGIASLQS